LSDDIEFNPILLAAIIERFRGCQITAAVDVDHHLWPGALVLNQFWSGSQFDAFFSNGKTAHIMFSDIN
jgi:hypothetical protein